MIEFEKEKEKNLSFGGSSTAKIKVIGIGGGGSNIINSIIDHAPENINFMIANTDAQALEISKVANKIQLGVKSTKGLGAGANPEIGRRAAEEDLDKIVEIAKDADIVFLAAGLGGGTGSGALPVIARILKEHDILTIAVVTKPFTFEGRRRIKIAEEAVNLIKREVDILTILPNQKLVEVIEDKVSLMQAFSIINHVFSQFVKSINDIIINPGYINVDFADIKTIMKQKGLAFIGTGRSSGEDRAVKAAEFALCSQLLEKIDISKARDILVNIVGPSDLGLHEMNAAASLIYDKVHEDANIVLGSAIDDSLDQDVLVTVIATGFNQVLLEKSKSFFDTELAREKEVMFNASQNINRDIDSENINQSSEQSENKAKTLDLNDLDIPTIMRKISSEKEF